MGMWGEIRGVVVRRTPHICDLVRNIRLKHILLNLKFRTLRFMTDQF